MLQTNEPQVKASSCSYCGDAPINHQLSFVESAVYIILDNNLKTFLKYTPLWLRKFADKIPEFLFRTFIFLRLAKWGDDINKANTFRSKIIWEEAARRGIKMEQVIFLGKPLDFYRATPKVNHKNKIIYFESIPIKPDLDFSKNWDDKIVLKRELRKHDIPIPAYFDLSFLSLGPKNVDKIFSSMKKPLIVKPRVGSRGRHTSTNIQTLEHFRKGIDVALEICSHLVVEEHLQGSVCRATFVDGVLAGFYRGTAPTLLGDGKRTIKELIEDIDSKRKERVFPVRISRELHDHLGRAGFTINDILPNGVSLTLTHRIGRLFGGETIEMIDDLHPSFLPILKKAEKIVGLSVVGFDAIIPDPTKPADSQKWGIIECNTLPFIDLHYYALLGKPRNIAGMIWDMWN